MLRTRDGSTLKKNVNDLNMPKTSLFW